jgi:hypothetical protein
LILTQIVDETDRNFNFRKKSTVDKVNKQQPELAKNDPQAKRDFRGAGVSPPNQNGT